jgi:hypothetical protein
MRQDENIESSGGAGGLAAHEHDRLVLRKKSWERSSDGLFSNWVFWVCLALVVAFGLLVLFQVSPEHSRSIARSSTDVSSASGPSKVYRASELSQSPAGNAIPEQPVPMVYRCVGKDGAVSLQSQHCSSSQRETRAVYAPPDATRPVVRSAVVAPAPTAVADYGFSQPAVDDQRNRERAACAAAKATRETVLAQVGLKRTYDLLHRLDLAVWEACKNL